MAQRIHRSTALEFGVPYFAYGEVINQASDVAWFGKERIQKRTRADAPYAYPRFTISDFEPKPMQSSKLVAVWNEAKQEYIGEHSDERGEWVYSCSRIHRSPELPHEKLRFEVFMSDTHLTYRIMPIIKVTRDGEIASSDVYWMRFELVDPSPAKAGE